MKSLYRKKLDKIYKNIDKLAIKGKDNFLEYYKYVDELVEKGDFDSLQQVLYLYYKIDVIEVNSIDTVKKNTWDKICFNTDTTFLRKLNLIYESKKVYQTSYNIYSSDLSYVVLNLSNPLSSTFSETGFTQSFSVNRESDIVYFNLLNDVKKMSLNESIWTDGVPTITRTLQNMIIGTSTGQYPQDEPIRTEISTLLSKDYLITTEERQSTTSIRFLNYKLEVTKSNYLGKIIENEVYTPDASYLVQNKQYARVVGARKTYLEVYKVDNSMPSGFATASIFAYDNLMTTEEQNLLTRYSQAIDYLNS